MYEIRRDFRLLQTASMVPTPAAAAGVTWSPTDKFADLALSADKLTITGVIGSFGVVGARATASASAGKYYWEITLAEDASFAGFHEIGVSNAAVSTAGGMGGTTGSAVALQGDGAVLAAWAGSAVSTLMTYAEGNVISIALDMDNWAIWWRVNGGNWNNNASGSPSGLVGGISLNTGGFAPFPAGAPYFPAICHIRYTNDPPQQSIANFGATAYAYTPPAGFGNWG